MEEIPLPQTGIYKSKEQGYKLCVEVVQQIPNGHIVEFVFMRNGIRESAIMSISFFNYLFQRI